MRVFTTISILLISSTAQSYSCANANQKYCKHMNSCSEAYYYYKNCGKQRLDRDRDGIPCEHICGKTHQKLRNKLKNED